MSDFYYYY